MATGSTSGLMNMAKRKASSSDEVEVWVAHPGYSRLLTIQEAEAVRKDSESPETVAAELEKVFKDMETRATKREEEQDPEALAAKAKTTAEKRIAALAKARAARAEKKRQHQEVQEGKREVIDDGFIKA